MRIILFVCLILIAPLQAMEKEGKKKLPSTASRTPKGTRGENKSWRAKLFQIKKKSLSEKKSSSKADSYDADTEESDILE